MRNAHSSPFNLNTHFFFSAFHYVVPFLNFFEQNSFSPDRRWSILPHKYTLSRTHIQLVLYRVLKDNVKRIKSA